MSGVDPARVSALVPCHREPPATHLLEGLGRHVGRVLVVDDGLEERGARRLGAAACASGAEVLRLRRNLGKGHALARGLAHVRGGADAPEAVLVLDADGQHPVAAVPAFLAAAGDAELLIGDRFGDLASMPAGRRFANRLVSRLLAYVAGTPVRDSRCGMRLLRGRALTAIELPEGRFESETCHPKRCLVQGVEVAWVPIPAIYAGPTSSFRPLRDGLRVLSALGDRVAPRTAELVVAVSSESA